METSEITDVKDNESAPVSVVNDSASEKKLTDHISNREDLTSYFEESNHSNNKVYRTKIPKICLDEPCMLGVDEAGRGPVLGPMVYGITFTPLSKKQLLVDIGCADSKTLSEEERDGIFDKIIEHPEEIGWAVEAISPTFICNSMYQRCKSSLNEVSMNSAIGLIKGAIEAGVNIEEIYVDTVGKPGKYQDKLKSIFPEIKTLIVAKKADSTYPVVSAASICAKVSRDHALRAWQFREGEPKGDYGTGYPHDTVTKQWLTDNIDPVFGFPQIVRFSWSTAEKILETDAETVEWENIESASVPKKQKISSFFLALSEDGQMQKKKHDFFTNRCITNTIKL
ncbi:GSCOCG00009784001-RA-CDS [Cotesia congregata]|uniref:Ribonuclease n=1 Tax=Cotesia congregata TaxID=51543 RepID=A0A8J2MF61_COTCN|nr:GSCOCG00009784001-RA-CDS [Cotesia congregata]CAG5088455.1 Similar to CG13690: Ribonuclease H2 subunit A (Drosophila melanogaster) [Cotesia congregata]